jgi:hypothetical protein
MTGLMGPLPPLPGPARSAKLRALAPPLTARLQSGQAVLEVLAALSVARPVMLTASPPSAAAVLLAPPAALSAARPVMPMASLPRTVMLMAPWLAVSVTALAAGLRAPLPLRVASWSLAPMGLLATEPAVLKGRFAAQRAPLVSITGQWARRIRPFPMGLTVPEHLLADSR